jgi:nucleotide-binding universal stress UspA family protein
VILAVRPLLGQIAKSYTHAAKLGQSILALIYCMVLISAVATEMIGIHLIFGAFLIGAMMPKDTALTKELAEKTEDFVLIVLLPIFFAYSGLRTQIGLLNSWPLWGLCGLVIVVAIAGKYIGTYVAARVSGIGPREASALGWLMNTRGLTELIVLNIGLSLGVITPLLFTMLVMMALVTTVMTSPLLEWTYPKHLIRQSGLFADADGYRVLVPVANPGTKTGLIKLATEIVTPNSQDRVYPMSLVQVEDNYLFESMPLEADRQLAQRRQELAALSQGWLPENQILPIVEVSQDVARTTVELTQREKIDLVLLGWHRPVFSSNRLGGRVGQILKSASTDVAVYIDRPDQAQTIQRILLLYVGNQHTELGLKVALRLLVNGGNRELSILRLKDAKLETKLADSFEQLLDQLAPAVRDRIAIPIVQTTDPIAAVVAASGTADLVIVGVSQHGGMTRQSLGHYTDELALNCEAPLLITRAAARDVVD